MKKLTPNQIEEIETKHNVYIDPVTEQFNVGGRYDTTYGWQPLPVEWAEEAIYTFVVMDNSENTGRCYIDDNGENCSLEENAKLFDTREDAQEYIDAVNGGEWAYIARIEK